MSNTTMLTRSRATATALAFLSITGCAGSQRLESKSRQSEMVTEEPTASQVLKAAPKVQQGGQVTENQRAEFERAVATYLKLRKGGVLKNADCSDAAAPFKRLAEENPSMLIARHNEASVYLECGRREEAMRIEEDLARSNYAPALSQLGYVAWRNGETAQAESFFSRAISADPQIDSVFRIVEGMGFGKLPPEIKARSLNAGAATREALAKAKGALEKDLDSLALPIKAGPKPTADGEPKSP